MDRNLRQVTQESLRAGEICFSRARDAFGAALDALGLAAGGGSVILPAYVGWSSREGSGVYDPVEARGLNVKFYPIMADLTIDHNSIENLLKKASGRDVLVLIHYFGRPDPNLRRIVQMARARNLAVIEDAAHGYFSAEVLAACGHFGDATLYSIHKMFNVSSGGILRLNSAALSESISPVAAGREINPAWLSAVRKDDKREAETRLSNYRLLARRIKSLAPAIMPLWRNLPEGTIPQNFPVLAKSESLRDRLYFTLKGKNFAVASLYHSLIKLIRPADFPDSYAISAVIFNLPLMPWLDTGEIERLGESLAEIAAEN